ncbi:hypothetical protein [Nannocystis pusilla]|uniref:hypothetical protein n=1 Tax=Nannocystis pusilla TaxID=889268 RepID=UPI003B80AE1F
MVNLGAVRCCRSHRSTVPLPVPTASQRPSGPSAATLPAPLLEGSVFGCVAPVRS